MMIYNSKKKGEKEKKNTWKRKQAWRCNKHKSVPFTTSLQAFASFLFYQLQSLHIPLALEHVAVRK
jgi:hypothetical protein